MVLLLKHYFFLYFFDKCCMIIIHMVFQSYYTICFIIWYKSFSSFCVWVKNMHVTKQTFHDLRVSKIDFFVIIHIINNLTNCILIMNFPYFPFEHAMFKGFFFHFIIFIDICYFFCCVLFYLEVGIQNFIFHIPFIYTNFIFTINYITFSFWFNSIFHKIWVRGEIKIK